MKKTTPRVFLILSAFLLATTLTLRAQGINTKKNYVRVDQFGYLENASKFAIIAKAVNGFNAGTGINLDTNVNVRLKRSGDNATVFQASATTWNGGGTDSRSGDRGWYFNFTSYTTPGNYYVQVTETGGNTVNSNVFKIGDNVYDDVLRAAMETFYYQRIGQNKTASYASGANWTDGPWYQRSNQDPNASYLYSSETRNVGKGWIDAGDPNKYVTFTAPTVHNLLTTYQQHEDFWKNFSLRIPENTNNLPDILDEIKWEVDWIKSMQRSDGTVHAKAGIREDGAYVSPPSTDTRQRWYSQTCPAAAITASGVMAHTAIVLNDFSSESSYVSDLTSRAENAWDAYSNAPDKQAVCDNGEIEAGDADGPGGHYLSENVAEAVCAAVYLYALTGKAKYNNFVKNNYTQIRGMFDNDWAIYRANQGESLLYYTTLPNADTAVKNAIIDRKNSGITRQPTIYKTDPSKDFYRFDPFFLNWGSNSLIARQGSDNYDYINYNLDTGNHSNYQSVADAILHYFHGVNPIGIVYLSNMYNYGGDFSVDQLWHTWFFNDGKYDGTPNGGSIVGPAPGYVAGGANPVIDKPGTIVTIGGVKYSNATVGAQPGMKAFSDENDYIVGESEAPYALVENAIYYQASYVKFLANYVAQGGGGTNPVTQGSQEIEGNFSVFNETGSNNTVAIDASNPGASNGQYVRLFDTNDELSTTFSVSEGGDYKLDLRVRTGEQSSNSTNNLAGQYEVRVNGTVRAFNFVNGSASALDGDTYWGLISRTQNLSAGTHTIRIKAKTNWLKADRLDYEKVTAPSFEDKVIAVTAPTSITQGETVTIQVEYSASTDRDLVVLLQRDGNPDFQGFESVKTDVGEGTATLNINLQVPSDLPVGNDLYQFQTYLTTNGGGFGDKLSNIRKFDVDALAASSGSGTIKIRAKGDCGTETMQLRVDGTIVKTWNNVGTGYATYNYDGFTSGEVRVHFTNDGGGSCDRNLEVDWIEVCGNRLQTETDATETSNCCAFDADKLYTNGNFNFGNQNCGGSSTNTITVRARGVNGEEVFELLLDDVKYGDQKQVTTNYVDYVFENVPSGSANVKVDFVNDVAGRDLRIDYIKINNSTLQAENMATNTGVWQNNSCGGSNSEWLHCSGYINFGNRNIGSTSLTANLEQETLISDAAIQVFPNPVNNGFLKVQSINSSQLQLFDLLGRQVFYKTGLKAGISEINLESVNAGLYILKVTDEVTKDTHTSKLVIE